MKQLIAGLLFIPLLAGAAEHQIETREAVTWRAGTEISVENLVGTVVLVPGTGNEVVVEATIIADARTAAEAEALARSVVLKKDGNSIWVEYPTGRHDIYRYRDGNGSTQTTTSYRGERVMVSSRDRDGVEVRANLRVTVPAGATLSLRNLVGKIEAGQINGTITLSTASGRIHSTGGTGALALNSGSGRLQVTDHTGSVEGRAGSGSIIVDGITGDLSLRAGSGGMDIKRVTGATHQLRAGSGGIRVEQVAGNLVVAAGSGSVRIGDLSSGAELAISTGSGSIRSTGDLSAVSEMTLRAGSGSIQIESSTVPDLKIVARAGSGSVSVDAPGIRMREVRRNYIEAEMGAATGSATLATGSGSISFRAGR